MPPAVDIPVKIARCIARHPNWTDDRISNAVTCHIGLVRAARAEQSGGRINRAKAGRPASKQRGKTLQQFRAQFDVRERIRIGLKAHLNGVYMTDQEFREACGIPAQDWRRFADLDDFEAYRWRYKGLIFWAQPKMVAAMKETVGAV